MKRRAILAGAVIMIAALGVFADDPKQQAPAAPSMEEYVKAAEPGVAHKKLDVMVGSWDTTVIMWMAPGAPPEKSSGITENRWILGGRQMEQRFKSSFMGMPFEGIGYNGYDNLKKHYTGMWMDNFSTATMVTTGSMSADGKTLTFTGTMTDAVTGKDSRVEEKVIVVDADHHVMEMWNPGPDGKMFKSMEIAYSRRK